MKNRIAILIIVSVILIMFLSACGATKDTATVNDLGKEFMTALRDEDSKSSWSMMTSTVQTEIGGFDKWEEYAFPRNFSDWDLTSTNVKNNFAKMGGEATLGADKYIVLLIFEKTDDEWKISGINFSLKK